MNHGLFPSEISDSGEQMENEDIDGNDRARTYWTPAMERYFIDLMIEQLHRGNRVGYTFNKHAWTDMLTVFNAKFGSQYEKDVLKGRYSNLWKQYSDVKNLLDQSCFSWDESHQMVIASDSVWDAYFRAHPDATSLYRTKPLLNFNDLCFIFGYTIADGRYSRSSHDQDLDDFNQGPNMGDGFVSEMLSTTERPRTDWTSCMDRYFIELMLDQLGRGNKSGDTFNKQAWTDMLTLFNEKFGPHHGKRVLRHRYQKLWKYYREATVLLKQEGFSWDGIQQMITAEDDVWNAYIKANPNARTYRNKTLPSYDDLALIYGHPLNEGCHKHDLEKVSEYQQLGSTTGEGKGRKSHSTSDRTRTYWTPPMDRFLIELLLDQVLRGHKHGQTFIVQAWEDMTMSFNAKFRSNYNKDVLKNRFKHLRKQVNDVNSLLKVVGFSWDDEREMVTAEDSTWDVYIKNHPDARSFRVKTVPGFHKLRVIFGEDSVHGQYSRLTLNMVTDAELPILMTGEDDENDQYCIDILAPTMEWTAQMETYFIDMMLKLVHEGNSMDPLSDGSAWTQMIVPFNEKFGLECDKYVLQEHYLVLMKKHQEISNLLSHSGFTWDGNQQRIIAENHVWETYIKEYPDAAAYRDKPLCNYLNLCKIFSLRVSDGTVDQHFCELQTTSNLLQLNEEECLQQTSAEVHQPRKRWMSSCSERKATKIQRQASEVGMRVQNSIEDALSGLEGISGMDEKLVLEACKLFQDDERKAKTFLALEGSLRKKWLMRKLRPS